MSTVNIFGQGNRGQAIAGLTQKAGHTAEFYGTNDTDKPVTGDIVVLAVPQAAVVDMTSWTAGFALLS